MATTIAIHCGPLGDGADLRRFAMAADPLAVDRRSPEAPDATCGSLPAVASPANHVAKRHGASPNEPLFSELLGAWRVKGVL